MSAPTIGPSLAGILGREARLADGSVVRADADYVRESIVEPDARTVAGYKRGVMTAGLGASRERLRDPALVEALVAFIASLH